MSASLVLPPSPALQGMRPPLARPIGGREIVVGMADMQVASIAGDRLITYALGSCLGIAVWDPEVRVGGLLHVMLPSAGAAEPGRVVANPFMFVDTGIPLLFRECYKLGAEKSRMVVKVAGGCQTGPTGAEDHFQIGTRNMVALRRLLARNDVRIEGEDVGGSQMSRTMSLDIATGVVMLKISIPERRL